MAAVAESRRRVLRVEVSFSMAKCAARKFLRSSSLGRRRRGWSYEDRLAIRYLWRKVESRSFTKSKWSLCLMLEFSWSVILEAVGAEKSPALYNFIFPVLAVLFFQKSAPVAPTGLAKLEDAAIRSER
jgi:hypothetical protein